MPETVTESAVEEALRRSLRNEQFEVDHYKKRAKECQARIHAMTTERDYNLARQADHQAKVDQLRTALQSEEEK